MGLGWVASIRAVRISRRAAVGEIHANRMGGMYIAGAREYEL